MRNIVFTLLISFFIFCCAFVNGAEKSEDSDAKGMTWTPISIFLPVLPYYGLSVAIAEESDGCYGLSVAYVAFRKNSSLIAVQLYGLNENFNGLAAGVMLNNSGITNGVTVTAFLIEREPTAIDVFLPLFFYMVPIMIAEYKMDDRYQYLSEIVEAQEVKSVNNAFNINVSARYAYHNGLSFSFQSTALENKGMMVSAFLLSLRDNKGVIAGGIVTPGVNDGFIMSLANFCTNNGVVVSAFSDVFAGSDGINIGLMTRNEFLKTDTPENAYSRQIGVLNFLKPSYKDDESRMKGFQFGAINVARSGLQIGLININPNSKIFPVMPFVNW